MDFVNMISRSEFIKATVARYNIVNILHKNN